MLTKRTKIMPLSGAAVKKTSCTALTFLILSTFSIAPVAYASNGPFTDVAISVKFKLSELGTEDGPQKVYEKFIAKAISSCRWDKKTLKVLDQTVDQCAAALVEQFVTSADIASLTAYHREIIETKKQVRLAAVAP